MRRLEDDEKPLQMQNEYLSNLGYGDPWRVQEEGMDPEIGCLIRFYAGECDLRKCDSHLLSWVLMNGYVLVINILCVDFVMKSL